MTNTTPTPTAGPRGFLHWPDVPTYDGGRTVQVFESSLATEACLWLRIIDPRDDIGSPMVQLTLEQAEQAEQLEATLREARLNHYQARDPS